MNIDLNRYNEKMNCLRALGKVGPKCTTLNSQVEVKAEVGAKVVVVGEDEELNRYRLTLQQEEEERTELLRKLKRRIKIIRRSAAQTPL